MNTEDALAKKTGFAWKRANEMSLSIEAQNMHPFDVSTLQVGYSLLHGGLYYTPVGGQTIGRAAKFYERYLTKLGDAVLRHMPSVKFEFDDERDRIPLPPIVLPIGIKMQPILSIGGELTLSNTHANEAGRVLSSINTGSYKLQAENRLGDVLSSFEVSFMGGVSKVSLGNQEIGNEAQLSVENHNDVTNIFTYEIATEVIDAKVGFWKVEGELTLKLQLIPFDDYKKQQREKLEEEVPFANMSDHYEQVHLSTILEHVLEIPRFTIFNVDVDALIMDSVGFAVRLIG